MVNVSDDTAMEALKEREGESSAPETTLQRARREFFEELFSPETPQWQKEMRLAVETPVEPATPIEDLDQAIARALVEAYRDESNSLPLEVRGPMYVVWDRLVATVEMS